MTMNSSQALCHRHHNGVSIMLKANIRVPRFNGRLVSPKAGVRRRATSHPAKGWARVVDADAERGAAEIGSRHNAGLVNHSDIKQRS
ncbi:hypothetical protein [Roseomonas genomospecies 6]|uniref:hypothetical protein n=1 Tax=Roseomonas genomospecies 6 TaxID=214106 RepID=UPI0011F2BECD|nr:hypothetical protein [Roseomonas genomospecies 6]